MTESSKKVEYLELVYDLIFVYIIGRNNSLLQHVQGGFVSGQIFLGYLLCTLAAIQIWSFSTLYINRYGKNGLREHVFLFTNMYLLYHMAEGTSAHWQRAFYRYNIAWLLILVNLGLQYRLELRQWTDQEEAEHLKRQAAILFIEAALVGVNMAVYRFTRTSLAFVPILFGVAATALRGRGKVDFSHLTERIMLYVVFTFGEMIIAISTYFTGGVTLNALYFSLMAFLIVSGLLLSYGMIYNELLDRERTTTGTRYMLLHVVLIFALNNITTALEFMREASVALLPKTVFLLLSLVLYYAFLFLLERYAKTPLRFHRRFRLLLAGIAASFVFLTLLLQRHPAVSIAMTALYVYGINLLMHFYGNRQRTMTERRRSP